MNGRICTRCGRPLNDQEHERTTSHRLGRRWEYGCKVRLVATSPTTKRTMVPHTPQRTKENDARYVHEDRLKPGGDLHD